MISRPLCHHREIRRGRYAISTGFLKHNVRVTLKFIKQEEGWMRGIGSVVPGSGEIYALLWVAVAVEAWSPSSSSPSGRGSMLWSHRALSTHSVHACGMHSACGRIGVELPFLRQASVVF